MKRLPTALTSDHRTEITTGKMQQVLLRRLENMTARSGRHFSRSQLQYKLFFDRKVRFLPTFAMGYLVYVDKPPPAAMKKAEKLTGDIRSKILPKTDGPFRILSETPDTVTIDEGGIPNTVSLDRVTAVPGGESKTEGAADENVEDAGATDDKAAIEDDQVEDAGAMDDKDALEAVASAIPETENAPSTGEYTVERIVGHKDRDGQTFYVVRWYGYTANDDTVESTEHLPENFVTQYW